MVQEQLVDYIKGQLRLGVSRDAVKAALVGAGWAAADVDDTLKKVEAPAVAAPSVSPAAATTTPSGAPSIAALASKPVVIGGQPGTGTGAKALEPHSIKISDLVSANTAVTASPVASSASSAGNKTDFFKSFSKDSKSSPEMMAGTPDLSVKSAVAPRSGHLSTIVLVVVAVILAGAAGYFFYQNIGLASQVSSLNGQSSNVTGQVTSLSDQMKALDASNTALAAEVDSLTVQSEELTANLSFLTAPAGATTTPQNISLSGALHEQRNGTFYLDTPYGVTAYVKNSSDALVVTALKPLLASSSSVVLAGTHVAGSAYFTVTTVNGTLLAPPVAASSTASSTSSATTTTP